jgi:hypothetical protein
MSRLIALNGLLGGRCLNSRKDIYTSCPSGGRQRAATDWRALGSSVGNAEDVLALAYRAGSRAVATMDNLPTCVLWEVEDVIRNDEEGESKWAIKLGVLSGTSDSLRKGNSRGR